MLKDDRGLTTVVPAWLVILAIVALLVRVGASVQEAQHPPKPAVQVAWTTPLSTINDKSASDKLILYYFTAAWCGSCKKLEADTFATKDIVDLINANFIPVKVLDRSIEEHVNAPPVQQLEDKYGVSTVKLFPRLIVALPDGTQVDSSIGAHTRYANRKFLQGALTLADYVHGREELRKGNYAKAASLLDDFLKKAGWDHDKATYAVVREYLALRLMGDDAKAKGLVTEAIAKLSDHKWPYAILKYLDKEISYEDLKKETGDSQLHRVEMHTVVGIALLLDGKKEECLEHLKWMVSLTEYRERMEYQLCKAALNKLENKPTAVPSQSRSVFED
jgi:thiol-disulfide isomerase/thioredoxin